MPDIAPLRVTIDGMRLPLRAAALYAYEHHRSLADGVEIKASRSAFDAYWRELAALKAIDDPRSPILLDQRVERLDDEHLRALLAAAARELHGRRDSEATDRVCDAVHELIDV